MAPPTPVNEYSVRVSSWYYRKQQIQRFSDDMIRKTCLLSVSVTFLFLFQTFDLDFDQEMVDLRPPEDQCAEWSA